MAFRVRRTQWILFTLVAVALCVPLVLGGFLLWAHARETKMPADAAPTGGRFVKAGDTRVFVQETGPPDGPVVLFVHGMGAWSEIWRDALTAVAADGFRAVALDLPPFGFSERRAGMAYSRRAQAERILGVLDALGVERAILVGHSFGGGPTMEATLLAPGRVRVLVLADAAIGLDDPSGGGGAVSTVLGVRPFRDALVAATIANPLLTRRLMSLFVADSRAVTEARVHMLQRPLVVRGATGAFGEWLLEFTTSSEAPLSKDPNAYRSLDVPTRVIWGDRDTTTPLDQGRRLAALIRGAELSLMPGVGHMPQIEDPEQFNRLVREFLGRHRS